MTRHRITFEIEARDIEDFARWGVCTPPEQFQIEPVTFDTKEMLAARLEFVLARTSTEDGVYTFPDGQSWPASEMVL